MSSDPMSIVGVNDVDEGTESNPNVYWATLPTDKIGSKLVDKVTDYDLYIRTFGLLWLWRRSFYSYYKNYFRGGRILRAGEVGQYKTITVNHYRSILQGLLTLITSQEPAFDPQAMNSDYKSQAQCLAAKNILDYEANHRHLNKKLKQATEKALLLGEGFVFLDYDMNRGEIISIDPETQKPRYDGELTVDVMSPTDVARDYSQNSAANTDWYILRQYKNKWDLCAAYPEFEKNIRGLGVDKDIQIRRFGHTLTENEDDLVCLYTFIHRKSPAVPNGRLLKFVDSETVLIDSPLPFDDFPVYRIAPSDQEETTFGYTVAFDLLAIQECIDKLISVIITNQLTFGVQNIIAPIGTKLSPQQLLDGLNLILTDMRAGIPQVLEMVKTPAEIYQFITFLIQQMELISGLNSVSRGVAPENLKSGTALAFVQSQAIQANSGLQQSYMRLLEDVGTGYLNILKTFAGSKKMQAIAGTDSQTYLTEFTAEDISGVSRVTVKAGNPLTKTTAGRIEVAQNLLQSGLFKTPEEFVSVVETGQIQSLTKGNMSELLHIQQENENLQKGMPVKAMFTDNHPLHMKEHMAVINSVDIRNSNDPSVLVTVNHIMEHMNLWQTVPPNILAGLGIQPPPMPMIAPGQPGGPQPVNPGSAGALAKVENPTNPIEQKAAQVPKPGAPKPPTNASPQAAEAMRQATGGQ